MRKAFVVPLIIVLSLLIFSGGFAMKEIPSASAQDTVPAQEPRLIRSDNGAQAALVADIVLTEAPYNADNSGREDVTSVLKRAVSDLSEAGGGTIYLPEGFYLLTGSVTVDNYITIAGDWRDPDECSGNYGTVIVADVPFSAQLTSGLFRLRANSGVNGLTVWYPAQYAGDVRPFPATFEIMGGAFTILEHIQFTIQNVTLLNSYRGVVASRTVNPNVQIGMQDAHEGLVIENLKGTPLFVGIDSVNESDIGYYKNVCFSPSYWSEAGEKFNAPSYDEVYEVTKNSAVGLKLGDLEWSPYYGIDVDGYYVGIQIQDGTRIQPDNPIDFMGGFYDSHITDCRYGLMVDALYKGWGMLFTGGRIEGENFAVANHSPVGYVRLTGVEIDGRAAGERIYVNKAEVPDVNTVTPDLPAPGARLFNVKDYGAKGDALTDDTAAVESALAAASSAGGGVVYMPAGFYKIARALSVGSNVLLRGCSSITNRGTLGNDLGTVIFSYYDDAVENASEADAFVTLSENAGISGLRICYPDNNLWMPQPGEYEIAPSAFTIRLAGDRAYVTNVGLTNSFNGIHVKNADNCVIKNIPALFFNEGVRIDGAENCFVENIFSNATVATQTGFSAQFPDLFKEGWLWRVNNLWNYYTYTETHTRFFVVNNSSVSIMSAFTFCSAGILEAHNSTVTMNGCGADRMYSEGSVLSLSSSSVTLINQLKYHCVMMRLNDDGNDVSIYGRMNLHLAEKPEVQNESEANLVHNAIINDVLLDTDAPDAGVIYPLASEWTDGIGNKNPLADIIHGRR